jgi:hypothetical protein
VPRNIVIAVDAKERTLDARSGIASRTPRLHPDARETLMELARAEDLEHAVMQEDLGELGVGEVLADVDVLRVHVLADGFAGAGRALLQRRVERPWDEPRVPECPQVPGEQRPDGCARHGSTTIRPAVVATARGARVSALPQGGQLPSELLDESVA